LSHKREYNQQPDLEYRRITDKVSQARMTSASKYYEELATVIDLGRDNKKKRIKNASAKLSFCHTSKNTIYCLFLHVAEIVRTHTNKNSK